LALATFLDPEAVCRGLVVGSPGVAGWSRAVVRRWVHSPLERRALAELRRSYEALAAEQAAQDELTSESRSYYSVQLRRLDCMVARPRKLLFVVTTSSNMGDLALCQGWIRDIGREDFRYGFVLDARLAPFLDERDERFFFAPRVHVKEAILAAADRFAADAIVFASNSFWNLPGQAGARFGSFPLAAGDTPVPLLSFDPFELGFEMRLPGSDEAKTFAPVPEWVWALRYMSRVPDAPNARHFCASRIFDVARRRRRSETLARWGGDPAKKTVVFPVSKNRFDYIREHYPGYYPHLATLFARRPWDRTQLFVLSPSPIEEFAALVHVVHVPPVPYEEFLALVGAADLYLTDSLISCIVDAFHLATPALLLANSEKGQGLQRGSFLDGRFFPYRVFPYGMSEICETLERRFEIAGCFEVAEVLNAAEIGGKLETLLYDADTRERTAARCRRWRRDRQALPAPREIVESLLAAPPL
jgi:Family of unknown function (DUF6365)